MNRAKEISITLLGTFILAVGVQFFILPYDILSGGVAGIAVAIAPLIDVPRIWIINFMVYSMFLLGSVVLGKSFAVKTVISSVMYPIFLNILELSQYEITNLSAPLASLYGGAIAGFGVAIVLRVGASTGGMDIPPLILNRLTKIKTSVFVFIIDGLTVCLGLFSYGIEAVLIGILSVVATTWIVDKVLTFGGVNANSVQIISEKWEEINTILHTDLDRGTTLIGAQGGYTKEKRMMILVIIDKKQYHQLIEIVNKIDSTAFIITSDVQDVHGEGFKLDVRV